MERKLWVVGAGDFARELLVWISHLPADGRDWRVAGFLDEAPHAAVARMRKCGIDLPVRTLSDTTPRSDDVFVCAIGDPRVKLRLCTDLSDRGAQFATIVHPTAVVGANCTLGQGVILCPYVVVTTGVSIGNHVLLNLHATAGHDAVIGDGCTLSCHCDVTGHAILERGVFMGSHASLLPGARVGEFATIGAGSVILRNAPPNCTSFGVPARPFR